MTDWIPKILLGNLCFVQSGYFENKLPHFAFYINLVSFLDFLRSLFPYDKHEYRNFTSCKSGKQVATILIFVFCITLVM